MERLGNALPLREIVCGIDPSPESREAAHQASSLAEEGARLTGVAVWNPSAAMHAGIHFETVADELRDQAVSALRAAEKTTPTLKPKLVRAQEVAGLLGAADRLKADLLSVGSHGTSRTAGILVGSVASAMVHHASCSVLVARGTGGDDFPRMVLHAGDGSPESLEAARVAGSIASRRGAVLVTLHVGDETGSAAALAEESMALMESGAPEPIIRAESGSPHSRIVEVANDIGASMIVVGSRGRTGLRALGSVSERVVHKAPCSVLVVRRPSHAVEEAVDVS